MLPVTLAIVPPLPLEPVPVTMSFPAEPAPERSAPLPAPLQLIETNVRFEALIVVLTRDNGVPVVVVIVFPAPRTDKVPPLFAEIPLPDVDVISRSPVKSTAVAVAFAESVTACNAAVFNVWVPEKLIAPPVQF